MKHIYMWFDGDIKRHYFSNKTLLNKWVSKFVNELMNDSDFCKYNYRNLKGKSAKEIRLYFSSSLFVEKIDLDI